VTRPLAPGEWREIRALFEELLDLPGDERARRLAGVADPDRRARVERLLDSDSDAGEFLERPAGLIAADLLEEAEAEPPAEPEPPLPERLGAYRVLGRLGRGGMGEVLLGERADGLFEQRVAIKLLRKGMDSEDVLRRFERERRILARVEHPHIARLFDGGAAPDGRPYFVLELVDGKPITVYCREHGLSVEGRLRLLLDCCDAVSAAHARLIVHRDLKPSNVLVTESGEVKLLDFGIAKVLEAEEGDAGTTREEVRLLTPAYAAPEQVLGEPVTTATDVWALGALGYELLTGTLPMRRDAREASGLAASVERETLERASSRVARTEPENLPLPDPTLRDRRRLERRLSGDLDNILATALRREPERRYASVAALAADVKRHLSGRPVSARPVTLGYRAGKFLRRNRIGVAAAALVLLSLLGGLAATAWQARRAQAQARAAAAAARRADAVKEFLIGLFEIADPEQSGGSVPASEILDQAGRRLTSELGTEPDVQADLLESVARIDRALGRLDPAEDLARRSVAIRRTLPGNGELGLGRSLGTLGAIQMDKGRLERAERDLARALAIVEAREGKESLAAARIRSDVAQAKFWKGDAAGAETLERSVYETYRRALGTDHVQTATHLRNLAVLLDELDRVDEAERAYRTSQEILEKKLGTEHPNTAQSYVNLASLLDIRRGRADEAESLYRRALDVRRKTLGRGHRAVGQTLQLMGLFYLNQARYEESEARYREALDIFRAIDPKHFEVGKIRNGLALVASRRGRYAEAEARLAEVEAFFREVLGEKHPFTWQAMGNRAAQIALQGRLGEAERLQRTVLAKLQELNGADSGEALDAESGLAETLRRSGRPGEALAMHRRVLEAQRKILGERSPALAIARYQVAADLVAIGRPEDRPEARKLLDGSLAALRQRSPKHWRIPEVLAVDAALQGRSRPDSARAAPEADR
jgi:eukaryotic-like serine/threonine-protein kinase